MIVLTNVYDKDPDYVYAVQVSEAVVGEPCIEALRKPELTITEEAFAKQVIGAFLTNPSDGHHDNYIYSPIYQTFISFDNEFIFEKEPIGKINERVEIKSVLYTLPLMQKSVPNSIKTFFATLDPQLTLLAWLKALSQKNEDYDILWKRMSFQKVRHIYENISPLNASSLDNQLLVEVEVDKDLPEETVFYPRITISQGLLKRLEEKLEQMKQLFQSKSTISLENLFEEVCPILGKYYNSLRDHFKNDIEEIIENFWKSNIKNAAVYCYLDNVLSIEDLNANESTIKNSKENLEEKNPDIFTILYKIYLLTDNSFSTPLERLIERHGERYKKKMFNSELFLEELQLLLKKNISEIYSVSHIIDFYYELKKHLEDHFFLQTVYGLLSKLSSPELKWLLDIENHFIRIDDDSINKLAKSSQVVVGALMKQRVLSESLKEQIFDKEGNIKKNPSLSGRSKVACFPLENPIFYFKEYPEFPGYEHASILFMRSLGVKHLPFQDLFVTRASKSFVPFLLTQKVEGVPVFKVWDNNEAFGQLDSYQTALLILSAMLLNPEDGKEDNYILSKDGKYLIPIDNDHCFLLSTTHKGGTFWNSSTVYTTLQTKTLLFCLDEMKKPIPKTVKQLFVSLDIDSFLKKWMKALVKTETRYQHLVSVEMFGEFFKRGTVLKIPFYETFIENMYWKMHQIQHLIRNSIDLTLFDLLKVVEPYVAKCYLASFMKYNTVKDRFRAITKELYTKTCLAGSRVSVLDTHKMVQVMNISKQDIEENPIFSKIGPLNALELLENLVIKFKENLSQAEKIQNEFLLETDDQKIQSWWERLFFKSSVEKNLKEFFKNPKEGLAIKGSNLITNKILTSLFNQGLERGARIKFLSLPKSPLLDQEVIDLLIQECPNLKYLDVSECPKLEYINIQEGSWRYLTRLEAKKCFNLKEIISCSPLKVLRIGSSFEVKVWLKTFTPDVFISLESKSISFSTEEEITITGVQRLFALKLLEQKLTLPDKKLGNQIFECLGQENLSKLYILNLSNNKINTQGIKLLASNCGMPNLKDIDISKNNICDEGLELIVSIEWPYLERLNLSATNITWKGIETLISKCSWNLTLQHLDISNNNLYDKGIELLASITWPNLEKLYACYVLLTDIGLLNFVEKKNNFEKLNYFNVSEDHKYMYREDLEELKSAFSNKWPKLVLECKLTEKIVYSRGAPSALIAGLSAVGKDVLIDRYLHKKFIFPGFGPRSDMIHIKLPDDQTLKVIFFHVNQFNTRLIPFRYPQGIILLYSIGEMESFEFIEYLRKTIHQSCDLNLKTVWYLVGNGNDLPPERREVDSYVAKEYAERHGMIFAEVSAKTGFGVDKLFENFGKNLYDIYQRPNSSKNL